MRARRIPLMRAAVVSLCWGSTVWTVELQTPAPAGALPQSLHNEALRAVRIGLQWLDRQQAPAGHWSNPKFPALTALAVWAHLRSPDAVAMKDGMPQVAVTPEAQKGIDYILSCVREDGSIYCHVEGMKGGGLRNYNTALCAVALAATNNPRYRDAVCRARAALIGMQHLGPDKFYGGMGYDASTQRAYADLSNLYLSLEALRLTEEPLGDLGGRDAARPLKGEEGAVKDLNWDAALKFITRCQNLPGSNDQPWVGGPADDIGGFVYHPGKSQAGERSDPDGETRLRSYGSMTYAGLLSFIYAKVDRDDRRVQAAFDWITRHYTLEENPGMGAQGLYYGYHTMAKALAAYGEEVLHLPKGEDVKWRPALVKKLVSLQRIDPKTGLGYWVNDIGRWWESDPVLATCYGLLALEIAMARSGAS